MRIINVSIPSNPVFLGSYYTGETSHWGITAKKNLVYLPVGEVGLDIVNVTNPALPELFCRYKTPGLTQDINIENNIAYIAGSESGLQILDLGQSCLKGVIPLNANNQYNLTVHATNEQGEWISTEAQLIIGARPPELTTTNDFLLSTEVSSTSSKSTSSFSSVSTSSWSSVLAGLSSSQTPNVQVFSSETIIIDTR